MATVEPRTGGLRRLLIGGVALGAAALGIMGSTIASADTPTDDTPSRPAVVECSSGIVTQGDVQTSSLSVTRVPAGEKPDVPGGCAVHDAG